MPIRSVIALVIALALALAFAHGAPLAAVEAGSPGDVRLVKHTTSAFDRYTGSADGSIRAWISDHFWRMDAYSPYFDDKTTWYRGAWLYFDSYAIYDPSPLADQHPEWILRDASGAKLYIDWGWTGSSYPQYAADISAPAFRRWWIGQAKDQVARGYRGLWIDDVNLEWRIADGTGHPATPIDRATGAPMTIAAWRAYFATFMEEVRAALPAAEIVHNSIWYANGGAPDDAIALEIAACDLVDLERGITDDGLTGGTGPWSVRAFLGFIDRVHAAGRGTVLLEYQGTAEAREYSLAGYFLVGDGSDGLAGEGITPDSWWSGYAVRLGQPLGARGERQGLLRRDFAGGIALLNEPGAPTRTVTLATAMRDLHGAVVTSVTLAAKRGAVLTRLAATGLVSGEWYKLVAAHSGKCLDVDGASAAAGAGVQQWADNGTSAQRWRIDAVGDGTWTLTARCSGDVLDIAGGSTADGGEALQWPLHGGANQRWRIDDLGAGLYRLTNVGSGKVLDIAGGSLVDGGDAIQWDDHQGLNQRWRIEPIAPLSLGWAPASRTGDAAGSASHARPSRGGSDARAEPGVAPGALARAEDAWTEVGGIGPAVRCGRLRP